MERCVLLTLCPPLTLLLMICGAGTFAAIGALLGFTLFFLYGVAAADDDAAYGACDAFGVCFPLILVLDLA